MVENKNDLNFKISPPHEGKCTVCEKEATVRSFGNIETKKVVSICEKCSVAVQKEGIDDISTLIDKYGVVDEKMFEAGVRFLGKPTAG